MNWTRLLAVALFGILSLSSLGEGDHYGSASSIARPSTAATGGSLGFSACTPGRPPYIEAPPQAVGQPVVNPSPAPKPAPSPAPSSQPSPSPAPSPSVAPTVIATATKTPEEKVPASDTEALGDLTPEGNAELELLNKNFDPAKNCLRLVKQGVKTVMEVYNRSCETAKVPVLTVPTEKNEILLDGKPVGFWDKVDGTLRLLELCSGRFAPLCKAVVENSFLKALAPIAP